MKPSRLKWPAAFSLARSDDGRLIACVGRNVVVIDIKDRVRVSTSHPLSHPSQASFSPNGELIAVKSTSGKIVTINPHTGAVAVDFGSQKEGEGCGPYFSPDGCEMIDGSWAGVFTIRRISDGAIRFRDTYSGEMLSRISHDRERSLWLIQHSPVVQPGENQSRPGYVSLHRWPIAGGTGRAFAFDMHIEAANMSPDGTRFCFFQMWDERRVHIARVSDGQIISSSPVIKAGGTGSTLAWSNDGKCIAALGDGLFVFLRADDLAVVGSAIINFPSSALFMQDDRDVILGSWKTSTVVRTEILLKP